jgi:hypothetical protein
MPALLPADVDQFPNPNAMNKRRGIFTVAALTLTIVGVWFWLLHQRSLRQSVQSGEAETNQPSLSDKNMRQRPTAKATGPKPSNPTVQAPDSVVENRISERAAELGNGYAEWRTPIEFYGKVVDDNTNPVAGAGVHFIWTDLSNEGTSTKDVMSDEQGRFVLSNSKGKNLIVQVSKKGYYSYEPFGAAFNYAGENQNFSPDSANPVIFRLKKKGVAEPLIHIQSALGGAKGFRLPKDGTPVEISLTSGKVVQSGGDLRVQCWTHNQGKTPGEHYDWKCHISIPDGGLVLSSNEVDFLAPSEGYKTGDVIEMRSEGGNDWSSHAKRLYFLKLANGHYARINFEVVAGGDHFFQLESFLNPSGSRTLEFDPQIAINP